MKRRALLLLGLLLLLTVVRVEATIRRDDTSARLAYLAARIDADDFPGFAPADPFHGEWKLMTLSWTAAAATNLAFQHPETRAARAEQVQRWAARILGDDLRAYETAQWGTDAFATLDSPEGHAGYLGHAALTLDAACLLGAKRDEQLHARIIDSLARRIAEAPKGLIETYPGEIYVPDNVVVVAAIAQYDACVGKPLHEALIARWLETMREHWLDDHTDVLVFAPGQPSRGSGAAWNSFYLPFIDEAFAAEQTEAMWSTFGDSAFGGALVGIREWPLGDERGGDVDSGPLVMGISPSATGFVMGDAKRSMGLARTAELVGVSFGGRYLMGPLVGDAIVLAARTRTRWAREPMSL
jgi:hypothetical protein